MEEGEREGMCRREGKMIKEWKYGTRNRKKRKLKSLMLCYVILCHIMLLTQLLMFTLPDLLLVQ